MAAAKTASKIAGLPTSADEIIENLKQFLPVAVKIEFQVLKWKGKKCIGLLFIPTEPEKEPEAKKP